jgi:hypothetical protein
MEGECRQWTMKHTCKDMQKKGERKRTQWSKRRNNMPTSTARSFMGRGCGTCGGALVTVFVVEY